MPVCSASFSLERSAALRRARSFCPNRNWSSILILDQHGTNHQDLVTWIYKPLFLLIKLAYSFIFWPLMFVGSRELEQRGFQHALDQVPRSNIKRLRNSQDCPEAGALNASFKITDEGTVQSAFLVEIHLGHLGSFATFPH